MNVEVFEAAVGMALKYAKHGVEGTLHGHTLVLGVPETLLQFGSRSKYDPFLAAADGSIVLPSDAEEVRRFMNRDGMTLIDGLSGAPVANGFFSQSLSDVSGGARSRSALWMAEQSFCIVIKISEDSGGEITIFCRRTHGSKPETCQFGV